MCVFACVSVTEGVLRERKEVKLLWETGWMVSSYTEERKLWWKSKFIRKRDKEFCVVFIICARYNFKHYIHNLIQYSAALWDKHYHFTLLFFKLRNWGLERLNNLLKIIELRDWQNWHVNHGSAWLLSPCFFHTSRSFREWLGSTYSTPVNTKPLTSSLAYFLTSASMTKSP